MSIIGSGKTISYFVERDKIHISWHFTKHSRAGKSPVKNEFSPVKSIGQPFRGNCSKFNLAHIIRLGRPQRKAKRCIVRLVKYRFVFEKIDNNLQFRVKKKASRNEITHFREMKSSKSCRMMPKYVWKRIWAIPFHLLWKCNYIPRTLFYQDENLPKNNL